MSTNYDNYECFRWNPNNNNINNTTSEYNNVLINTGSVIKGQWENTIAIVKINEQLKIIDSSNHFVKGYQWGENYNKQYGIYDNIVKNYLKITDELNYVDLSLYNDKKYFYMINPFCFSNSGHDLSIMLDFYNYIKSNNIKDIIILKGYKNTNNFKILSLIFSDDLNFHELDLEKVYKFKNMIIIEAMIYNIYCHQNIIDEIKLKIIELYSNEYLEFQNRNIINNKIYGHK